MRYIPIGSSVNRISNSVELEVLSRHICFDLQGEIEAL